MGAADRYAEDEERRRREWLASRPWYERLFHRVRVALLVVTLLVIASIIAGIDVIPRTLASLF